MTTNKLPALSAILRTAIDNNLWEGTGKPPNHAIDYFGKPIYICDAVERTVYTMARELGVSDSIAEFTKGQLVEAIMYDIDTYNASTFQVALSRSAANQDERNTAWANTEEVQQLRYMYADFLAYMLEDEGN